MNTPKELPKLNGMDIARFWSKVDVREPHQCWQWQASTFRRGYGQHKVQGRNLKAHRIAYFLHYGSDPGDSLVCHDCDNPGCCNPLHMFLGDNAANSADAKTKGRMNTPNGDRHGSKTRPESVARGDRHSSRTHPELIARGERSANAKLTLEKVQEIRRLYAAGAITQEQLGKDFGVSRREVGGIIKGKRWRHAIADGEQVDLSDPRRKVKLGVYNGSAKLSENDVREIRQRSNRGVSAKELARQFDVRVDTIYHIRRGITWSHIL